MKKLFGLLWASCFWLFPFLAFAAINSAQIDEDVKMMKELTYAYSKATVVLSNYVQANRERNDALKVINIRIRKNTPQLVNETVQLIHDTSNIIPQIQKKKHEYNNTNDGKKFAMQYRKLSKAFGNFLSVERKFVNSALSSITNDVKHLNRTIELSRQHKNGQYFINAIYRDMVNAEQKLAIFKAISGPDEPQVQKADALVKDAKTYAEKVKKELEQEILRVSRAPKDNYRKNDREKLIAVIEKAWRNNNPNDQIMEIRIPYKDWRRESGIEWNSGYNRWERYDRQYLQFAVVVKTDDKVATIYPAFINRDNIKNTEKIVASHKSTYEIRKVLIKNLNR